MSHIETSTEMAKRKSEEPLENIAALGSLATKKARVEDVPEEEQPMNGLHADSEQSEHDGYNGTASDKEQGLLRDAGLDTPGSSSDYEEEQGAVAPLRQKAPVEGYSDLYLDT